MTLTHVHPIDQAQQSVQNAADKSFRLPLLSIDFPSFIDRFASYSVVQSRLQILTESEIFNCHILWAASQSTERVNSLSLSLPPYLPPSWFLADGGSACQSLSKHSSKSFASLSLSLSLSLSPHDCSSIQRTVNNQILSVQVTMCRGARERPPILVHPYTHSLHQSFLSPTKV